jgi:hypothetical protein
MKVLTAYVTTGPAKPHVNALIHLTGAQGTPHWWITGIILALVVAVAIAAMTRRTAR